MSDGKVVTINARASVARKMGAMRKPFEWALNVANDAWALEMLRRGEVVRFLGPRDFTASQLIAGPSPYPPAPDYRDEEIQMRWGTKWGWLQVYDPIERKWVPPTPEDGGAR